MVTETPDTIGRRTIVVPDELHARLGRIMAVMGQRTGRKSITFAEVIERALDKAGMEGDR